MKSLLLSICVVQVCLAASLGSGANCLFACPEYYAPICGSDGKTYGNKCFLTSAQCSNSRLTVAHVGRCLGPQSLGRRLSNCPDLCPMIWAPVCGSDGITYSSSCVLSSKTCGKNVTVAHKGACAGDLLDS